MKTVLLSSALAACGLAASASATIINFDDLPSNVVVTNQYPEATFSANPGETNRTLSAGGTLGESVPNFLCTYDSVGAINCALPTYIDFTNPVNGLTFTALALENNGLSAQVNVFENNAFSATVNINGIGNVFVPITVNLGAFTNITRIELVGIIDPGGIGWDDFSFTPVPSPAAATLLGLAGLSVAGRRRQ